MSSGLESKRWTDRRAWRFLLVLVLIECVVIFGPGLKALAFASFGFAVVILAQEGAPVQKSDALLGLWLAGIAIALLFIGVLSHQIDTSVRPIGAAVGFGGAVLVAHLLHPAGLGRREVMHSSLVAFGLGFAGWIPTITAFVAAAAFAGAFAAVQIVRTGPGRPTTVPFSTILAVSAIGAIPLA